MCALLVPSFAVMYKPFAPLVYDALKPYKTILHQDLIINQTQIYAQDTVDTKTKISSLNEQMLDFDDVSIKFEQKEIIQQGTKSIITYQITNKSDAILVFGVGTSKYGSVYKRLNKIYHNTLEQKQTPPVFFHFPKVLAVNSTTEERLEITPLQSGVIAHPVSLSFFKINATDVNKLFVLETALSGEPGDLIYQSIKHRDELKNMQNEGFTEILIPEVSQHALMKTVKFQLKIDVRKNDEFQKLYTLFKPREIVELQEIAQIALYTGEGTILLKDGEAFHIGEVELSVLERIEGMKGGSLLFWVESGEGPLEIILKKYGMKNEEDLMYHGAFSYSLELPREELLNLFSCIRDGNYKIKRGSGIMYENEIWILYETK